ncbi:MAG: twin-arginine translocase subunit TatC [Kiritimatiellae bacterium]|nr:twin-arginine translocase subunit TatC [Kiritimatiellia bacterium]MBR2356350.1 twin-arginine translocase subunit TatC [Kiritimatiellia bacterium]MBR2939053.1 twin-arginine translocase subunit TatC [Kiritimatiellia bacterium]
MAIDLIAKPDERNDPPRPLLEHLLALRDMLVFAAVSWACGVVVAGVFAPQILELLKAPAAEFKDLLQVVGMTAPFDVWMSIAAWGGTVLSFPLVSFAVLRFVFPALTNREKLVILCGISFGTALFLAGAVLAYGKTLPLVVVAFRQIGRWMGIEQQIITIDTYIPIVLKLIVAFGLVFQMPLIIFVLGCFGMVTSQALREKRRIAIVVAFVLSMFLTPPDPMSQIVMAVPLCLLYEISIWAVWLREKGRFRR